ncbi:MAG: hypothetical protein H7Y07_09735 [Pyrinomonadaceae bacterium]|nr:hypothetical protein [Sphingobacteriaceae bacterium]
MQETKIISGNSQEEIWKNIESDFSQNSDLFEYDAIIDQHGRKINLTIDIDLGGGFEGGYAFTSFITELETLDSFQFALHHQDFMDEIGKFFGMEDVELGYPEFDKNVVVKTNDINRLQDILSDQHIREILQNIPEFNFHIIRHTSDYTLVEAAFLELRIEDGITETRQLRDIYNVFVSVMEKVDEASDSILKYL